MTTFGGFSRNDDDLPSIKEFRRRLAELDEEPRPRTIEEARARLQEELAAAREDIARAQAEATFTEEEREAFTIAAQRGEMGEKMREVADRVAAGKETWDNVFSNRSPDSPAFAEFLERAREEQMPDLKRRIEAKDLLR